MNPIFTHIQVESPDLFHTAGQLFCSPISINGRSYTIENGKVTELPPESLLKRVIVVALAIILFPLTLIATLIGAICLQSSMTYQKACEAVENRVSIKWEGELAQLETQHFLLKPTCLNDAEGIKAILIKEFEDKNTSEFSEMFSEVISKRQNYIFTVFDGNNQIVAWLMLNSYSNANKDKACLQIDMFENRDDTSDPKITAEIFRAGIAYGKALKEKGALLAVSIDEGSKKQPLGELRVNALEHSSYSKELENLFAAEHKGENKVEQVTVRLNDELKSVVEHHFVLNLGDQTVTHQDAYEEVKATSTSGKEFEKVPAGANPLFGVITWNGNLAEIETEHLILKPTRMKYYEQLWTNYKKIFPDTKEAKRHTDFCNYFDFMEKLDSNCSFTILDKNDNHVIGMIDFNTKETDQGSADAFMNTLCCNISDSISEEIFRAVILYAKALQEKEILVPVLTNKVPEGFGLGNAVRWRDRDPDNATQFREHIVLKMPIRHLRVLPLDKLGGIYKESLYKVFIEENNGKIEQITQDYAKTTSYVLDLVGNA